jgi:hypothetical protein
VATAVGQHLARLYGGDLASAGWRHLGRLAGFTNQKPQRRTIFGYAPWVKIVYAGSGLASGANGLLQPASEAPRCNGALPLPQPAPRPITAAEATAIYFHWVNGWRMAQRFPQPDWSIVDLWIARELLAHGTPAAQVSTILRLASPHFPRRHGDPEDYLRRTVARAAFPAPGRAVWAAHARTSAAIDSACSNSTGGR